VAEDSARWGWHQLDSRWACRLAELAQVQPGDLVLDIGAGTGAITEVLVGRGASVIAFELHNKRAAQLRRRFADDDVRVVGADAADLRLPGRPFKVVANPPFGIATSLLRRLTCPRSRLQRAAIVLPTWAVTRWAAGRGVGGITSKRGFTYRHGPVLPPHAFRPAPPTRTAILLVDAARRG
jgi:23S rRNA (adenine-N6)-dimethyltransferase